jgi:hypothetical protein
MSVSTALTGDVVAVGESCCGVDVEGDVDGDVDGDTTRAVVAAGLETEMSAEWVTESESATGALGVEGLLAAPAVPAAEAPVVAADCVEFGCADLWDLCWVEPDPLEEELEEEVEPGLFAVEDFPDFPRPGSTTAPVPADVCGESVVVVDEVVGAVGDVLGTAGNVFGTAGDVFGTPGDAKATPAGVAIAIPTPRTKAKAPIRPTYLLCCIALPVMAVPSAQLSSDAKRGARVMRFAVV